MSARSVVMIGVACSLVLATSSAEAQVWRGDFETGDLSQFSTLNQTIGGHDYITVVGDVVASGAHAGRIALHDDAVWPNGLKRVELHHSPAAGRTAEGAELYFAWSFYLPETLPTDPDQTIGYWETNTSYHQLMAFVVRGEDLEFYTQLPSYHSQWIGTGVVTPATWHRIAMHIRWSQSASGQIDVWLDGSPVVMGLSVPTLADTNEAFTQFGLLRGAIEFTDVPVIYVDDAQEGNSLADVHYDVLPSVTPDAGAPDAATPIDAATIADAASPIDAAARDGGRADGGAPTAISGGCGCVVAGRGASSSAGLAALALLIFGARRTRRRG
jgi:MYXO-CTERM domain-containing protein